MSLVSALVLITLVWGAAAFALYLISEDIKQFETKDKDR